MEAYFASAGVFASATGAGAFVSVAVVEEQPTTENANTIIPRVCGSYLANIRITGPSFPTCVGYILGFAQNLYNPTLSHVRISSVPKYFYLGLGNLHNTICVLIQIMLQIRE